MPSVTKLLIDTYLDLDNIFSRIEAKWSKDESKNSSYSVVSPVSVKDRVQSFPDSVEEDLSFVADDVTWSYG